MIVVEDGAVLYLGTESNNYTEEIKGYSIAIEDRFYHHCITSELIPNTKYYYMPGKCCYIICETND